MLSLRLCVWLPSPTVKPPRHVAYDATLAERWAGAPRSNRQNDALYLLLSPCKSSGQCVTLTASCPRAQKRICVMPLKTGNTSSSAAVLGRHVPCGHSTVGVVTGLRAGSVRRCGTRRVPRGTGAHPGSCPVGTRGAFPLASVAGLKLTSHIHLAARLLQLLSVIYLLSGYSVCKGKGKGSPYNRP
jgi:hypothetical protein